MALPTSGPMSLSMIRGEFGGTGPVKLSDYYRGGGRVPNTPVNAGVPSSGPIRLSHFYGATAYTTPSVSITQAGGTIFQPEPAPATQVVSAALNANGTGGTGNFTWAWRETAGGPVMSTAASLSVSATVTRNSTVTITRHLTWSDGVNSGTLTRQAVLEYLTDV